MFALLPLVCVRLRKLSLTEHNPEAAALEVARPLMAELDRCADATSLRSLVPRLQSLSITAGLLQESPSIIELLAAAAKRCRKSKDKEVSQLLSNWAEIRNSTLLTFFIYFL